MLPRPARLLAQLIVCRLKAEVMGAFVVAGCLHFALLLLKQYVLKVLYHAVDFGAFWRLPLKEITFGLDITGPLGLGAYALRMEPDHREVWHEVEPLVGLASWLRKALIARCLSDVPCALVLRSG